MQNAPHQNKEEQHVSLQFDHMKKIVFRNSFPAYWDRKGDATAESTRERDKNEKKNRLSVTAGNRDEKYIYEKKTKSISAEQMYQI